MKTLEFISRTIPTRQIVHCPQYVQRLMTPPPLFPLTMKQVLRTVVENGTRPHPSFDSLKIYKLILNSAVGKCALAGLGSNHLQLNSSGARRWWLGRKKCPKQFAVRHSEPQSIRRVHFEAFVVSLVLLNGQNEIVFSHPEQTALYSIKEVGGGGWNWLFRLVRPNSPLLFTESLPVFQFLLQVEL